MAVYVSEFELGELVYVYTDLEQECRMVVNVRFLLGGGEIYQLSCGTTVTDHYGKELTHEPRSTHVT